MDETTIYIKMCKKAVEIQKLWKENIDFGDFTDAGKVTGLEEYYDMAHGNSQ